MAKRFIKLYEQITSWEWFTHPNTLALFIYLLLKANYKDISFQGRVIRRGQLVTSLPKLSTGCGLSIQQTRTALSHLISTGEITDEAIPQCRIITVVKYDDYQTPTGELTGNQQAINRRVNRQSTDETTPSIEYIENTEGIERIESPKGERTTAKRFVPPTKEEILDFCIEEGFGIDVDYLYDYYSSKGWKIGSSTMKDWRAAVRNWARRDEKIKQQAPAPRPAPVRKITAQQYTQRDYSNEQEEAMARMIAMFGGGDE